jgi:hypothetical protein
MPKIKNFSIKTSKSDIRYEGKTIGGYNLYFKYDILNDEWELHLTNQLQNVHCLPYSHDYFKNFHIPYIELWFEEMILKYA